MCGICTGLPRDFTGVGNYWIPKGLLVWHCSYCVPQQCPCSVHKFSCKSFAEVAQTPAPTAGVGNNNPLVTLESESSGPPSSAWGLFLIHENLFSQGVRTPVLQLSAMQEGDYTYQLIVTDSAGHQSTAEVTVIVQPGKLPLPALAASLPGVGGEQQSVSNLLWWLSEKLIWFRNILDWYIADKWAKEIL